MIYLIGHLAPYLIAAFLFAAIAGWTVAAQRAAPDDAKRRRDRDKLLREVARLNGGGADDEAVQVEREADALRRRLSMNDGRIVELESALERARARGDEAIAELETLRGRAQAEAAEAGEVGRLRALVAAHEEERAREVEVEALPVEPSEAEVLQTWRLRYFEQRVKYLEGLQGAAIAPMLEPTAETQAQPAASVLHLEWRAREAEARAAYLADQARVGEPEAAAPEAGETSAFAANVDVDALLRWRMLYLERRVAHLQATLAAAVVASAPKPEPEPEPPLVATAPAEAPHPDIWKWRARYLEARIRHLQAREPARVAAPVVVPAAAPAPTHEPEPQATPAPALIAQKPAVLSAARNGAPDDLTLIEHVSALQQTTLNAIGVYHFDQIAAWTEANVAWIDRYFRLRGRVAEEEWVEQAAELARDGVIASRRLLLSEDA